MLLILKMNKHLPLHPNSSYYQMCTSKETKKVILLILSGNPNLFLDLKRYHSLEHADLRIFFLVRYLFCKGKLMVWFLQLSLWSKILALNMKEIKI